MIVKNSQTQPKTVLCTYIVYYLWDHSRVSTWVISIFNIYQQYFSIVKKSQKQPIGYKIAKSGHPAKELDDGIQVISSEIIEEPDKESYAATVIDHSRDGTPVPPEEAEALLKIVDEQDKLLQGMWPMTCLHKWLQIVNKQLSFSGVSFAVVLWVVDHHQYCHNIMQLDPCFGPRFQRFFLKKGPQTLALLAYLLSTTGKNSEMMPLVIFDKYTNVNCIIYVKKCKQTADFLYSNGPHAFFKKVRVVLVQREVQTNI